MEQPTMSLIARRVARSLVRALVCLPFVAATAADATEGVVTAPSIYPVAETTARLEDAVRAKDFIVFATVDHAAGATKVGMMLRPTTLVIFGNPRGGTPLMTASQSAGLDLPLKMLVWQDEAGKVWLSYNDPVWIARRHGVDPTLPAVAGMTTALDALAAAAGKE